jgi:hypothetical protein
LAVCACEWLRPRRSSKCRCGKCHCYTALLTLFASMIATAVSWLALPAVPTYIIPAYSSSTSVLVWALLMGPIVHCFRSALRWAYRNRPRRWQRLLAPAQILCNGKDLSQLLFTNQVAPASLFRGDPKRSTAVLPFGGPRRLSLKGEGEIIFLSSRDLGRRFDPSKVT